MGDKLVPVGLHLITMCIEDVFGDVNAFAKVMQEGGWLGDDLLPMMLPVPLTKELAPLENADIEKVTVRIDPEVVF